MIRIMISYQTLKSLLKVQILMILIPMMMALMMEKIRTFDPLNEILADDFDGDGIPNEIDPDDDNDGVPDSKDRFPFNSSESSDLDGDGIGDNSDPDLRWGWSIRH